MERARIDRQLRAARPRGPTSGDWRRADERRSCSAPASGAFGALVAHVLDELPHILGDRRLRLDRKVRP